MRPRIHHVDSADELQALVSPVRQEIVDTLAAYGECSIAEIAQELGRPADGLYYHVRALLRAGLLEIKEKRPAVRRSEAIYRIAGGARQLRIRYRPRERLHRETLQRAMASALRTAERDFAAGLTSAQAEVSGKFRNLWGGRRKGWLSREEVAEVNALIERLLELFSQPRTAQRDSLHALSYVFAPVEARDRRRE